MANQGIYSNYATNTTYTPYNPAQASYSAFQQQINPNLKINTSGQIIGSSPYSLAGYSLGASTANIPNQSFSANPSSIPAPASTASAGYAGGVPNQFAMASSAPASTPGYNATPSPQAGQGAYGAVPGATALPPSTYQQAQGVMPNLPQQTQQAGNDVMNELNGVLSPETINMIQNHAASFGVQSGVPGSQFAGAQGLRQLGLTTEQLQNQGIGNYLSTLQGVSNTQLDPQLMAQISENNAQLAAAPNPQAAAQAMEQQYLQNLQFGSNLSMNQLRQQYQLAQQYSPSGGTIPSNRGITTLGPSNIPSYNPYALGQNTSGAAYVNSPGYNPGTVTGGALYPSTTAPVDNSYTPYGSWGPVTGSPTATGSTFIGNDADAVAGTGGYMDPVTGTYYDDSGQEADYPAQ